MAGGGIGVGGRSAWRRLWIVENGYQGWVKGIGKGNSEGGFSWMAGWQARKGTSSWAWIEKRGLGCFELSQSRWRAKGGCTPGGSRGWKRGCEAGRWIWGGSPGHRSLPNYTM